MPDLVYFKQKFSVSELKCSTFHVCNCQRGSICLQKPAKCYKHRLLYIKQLLTTILEYHLFTL